MKITLPLRSTLAVVLGGLTIAASACPPPDGPLPHDPLPGGSLPMSPFMPMPPMPHLHGLKLSAVQQDKLFELMQGQAKARHEAMRTAGQTMDELRQLARAKTFDEAKARSLAGEHGQQIARLSLLNAQADAGLRSLLTDEQRQILDAQADPADKGDREKSAGKSCRTEKH